MKLEPLESDLLDWLFGTTGRRTGVHVDSADFLALHPEVDRHEVTTAVEILESLLVKANRSDVATGCGRSDG